MSVNVKSIKEISDQRFYCVAKAIDSKHEIDSWYAKYVLGVLLLVYIFNFVDRQILAILAEDIKKDLEVSDAQLGFLFGTAFAVFYATFGIVLGRLADAWNRKKLISLGLSFWSLMTTLSGFASSFAPLAICRFGVGIGESSASPAAYSLLYDYFSPKIRTTVLAIYSSGAYIGMGLGLFVGGAVLGAWNSAWPEASSAPFGVRGWQAALIIVGLPGILMAMWVSTLREPVRGAGDDIVSESERDPFGQTAEVLISMLPFINCWMLVKKDNGFRAVIVNLAFACVIVITAWSLIIITDDVLQWTALGVGAYAVFSWAQGLSARDPVIFGLIFKSRTLSCLIPAGGAMAFMTVALGFWVVPFLQRYHGISATEAGSMVGLATGLMGLSGVILGGCLADRFRQYTRKGKLYMYLCGLATATVSAFIYLTVDRIAVVYAGIFLVT